MSQEWSRTRKARYRAGVTALRGVLRGALNGRFGVEGAEKLPDGPAVIATNHLSYIDAFTVGLALEERGRTPVFMVRRNLTDTWLIGGFIRAGAVLIDSGGIDSSRKAWAEAIRYLRNGHDLVVAPEHAISKSMDLLPLKTGAVRLARKAGVPLVPAANFGSQRLFPDMKFRPTLGVNLSVRFGAPLFLPADLEPAAATDRLRTDLEMLLEQVLDDYPDRVKGERGAPWWPKRRGGAAVSHDVALAGHLIDNNVSLDEGETYIDSDIIDEVSAALADLDELDSLSEGGVAAEIAADLEAAARQLGTLTSNPLDALNSMLASLDHAGVPIAEPEEPEVATAEPAVGAINFSLRAARPDLPDEDGDAADDELDEEAVAAAFRLVLVDPAGDDEDASYEFDDGPTATMRRTHQVANEGGTLADVHGASTGEQGPRHLQVITGEQGYRPGQLPDDIEATLNFDGDGPAAPAADSADGDTDGGAGPGDVGSEELETAETDGAATPAPPKKWDGTPTQPHDHEPFDPEAAAKALADLAVQATDAAANPDPPKPTTRTDGPRIQPFMPRAADEDPNEEPPASGHIAAHTGAGASHHDRDDTDPAATDISEAFTAFAQATGGVAEPTDDSSDTPAARTYEPSDPTLDDGPDETVEVADAFAAFVAAASDPDAEAARLIDDHKATTAATPEAEVEPQAERAEAQDDQGDATSDLDGAVYFAPVTPAPDTPVVGSIVGAPGVGSDDVEPFAIEVPTPAATNPDDGPAPTSNPDADPSPDDGPRGMVVIDPGQDIDLPDRPTSPSPTDTTDPDKAERDAKPTSEFLDDLLNELATEPERADVGSYRGLADTEFNTGDD